MYSIAITRTQSIGEVSRNIINEKKSWLTNQSQPETGPRHSLTE